MPSPVQCSPFVVGRCRRSGRYLARRPALVKSAPEASRADDDGPVLLHDLAAEL